MTKGQRVRIVFLGKEYYGPTVNSVKAKILDDIVGEERVKVECCVYQIKPEDTLYDIAKKFLGYGEAWPRIAKINRPAIPDANVILPGTVITLPKYLPIKELMNDN